MGMESTNYIITNNKDKLKQNKLITNKLPFPFLGGLPETFRSMLRKSALATKIIYDQELKNK